MLNKFGQIELQQLWDQRENMEVLEMQGIQDYRDILEQREKKDFLDGMELPGQKEKKDSLVNQVHGGERAFLGHPAQLAKKVTQEGMDILDFLVSLDKKVSLGHQAHMVLLVWMDPQVYLEEDQEETLALLDHKDQEDFLAPQVFLDKMDLMEP